MFNKTLPYYPLNDYDELNRRREFNIHLKPKEAVPDVAGTPLMNQQLLANMMDGKTPINSLLVFHGMGTGKTCTAVHAIEMNFKDGLYGMRGAIILNRGKAVADNFIRELLTKCTIKYSSIKELSRYTFDTFEMFAKKIEPLSDSTLISRYNNMFIVIDEVHNILNEESRTYTQIYRLVHLLPNMKLMLLTGTPVRDTPQDVVPILNLLLPVSEKIDDLASYYDSRGNLTQAFRKKVLGRVSYLDTMQPDIKIEYKGDKILDLQRFKVVRHTMSKLQSAAYLKAYERDSSSGGIYTLSRQAVRFVFPDGSYGSSSKYMTKKNTMTTSLINDLKRYGVSRDAILKRIEELSVKYAYIIRASIEADARGEKTFIYDDLVKGSGLMLLHQLFQLVGFTKIRILTSETTTVAGIKKAQELFNSDPIGSSVSVILGSRVVAEGLTFLDVLHEHIVPHWNNTETMQVLARGIRFGSHRGILKIRPNAEVSVYRHVTLPLQSPRSSIDYIMTKTSEEKDIAINKVLDVLKEASITCNQFIARNGGWCMLKKPTREVFECYADKHWNERLEYIKMIRSRLTKHESVRLADLTEIPECKLLDIVPDIINTSLVIDLGVKVYIKYRTDTLYTVEDITLDRDPQYSRDLRPMNHPDYNETLEMLSSDREDTQRLLELAVTSEMLKRPPTSVRDELLDKHRGSYKIESDTSATVWYKRPPRCLRDPVTLEPWNEWFVCSNEVADTLIKYRQQAVDDFEATVKSKGMTHYGLWNPTLKEFCLREVGTSAGTDRRKIASGKRCVNWSKKDLLKVAEDNNLTLDPDKSRPLLCDDLYELFKARGVVLEDRSCGVQTKVK